MYLSCICQLVLVLSGAKNILLVITLFLFYNEDRDNKKLNNEKKMIVIWTQRSCRFASPTRPGRYNNTKSFSSKSAISAKKVALVAIFFCQKVLLVPFLALFFAISATFLSALKKW